MRLGIACDQRFREAMEDRVAAGPAADGFLVAVFDGHGGWEVADRAASRAVKLLEAAVARDLALEAMWADIFAGLDAGATRCGSTATLLFARGGDLSVGWVGDSRAVLVRSGGFHVLTPDHRIDRMDERRRVLAAGGVIEPPYAVDPHSMQGLMVTRALGDRALRRIGISAIPEVVALTLGDTDIGFVAATDGLWDVVSSGEAAMVCRHGEPQAAADRLVGLVADRAGADNVSVVVARFD
jgi:serine/threonine protein phosphatase PrpC